MRFSKRFIKSKRYTVDSIGWNLDRKKTNAIAVEDPAPRGHWFLPERGCLFYYI